MLRSDSGENWTGYLMCFIYCARQVLTTATVTASEVHEKDHIYIMEKFSSILLCKSLQYRFEV